MQRLISMLCVAALTAAGFVLSPQVALASTCSVPNVFSNGTTADATQVNANFSALVSCGNAIDNTNIGASGIYASQIKPTTGAQATFGGTVGYTFNPSTTSVVPLTISNSASPTADYLDVSNSVGTKLVYVDSTGKLNTNGAPAFGAPLGVGSGGTGTSSPALVAGANIGITGSWPGQTVAFLGTLPVANGGTGSSTQNFVDLSSAQTIGGAKTFSSVVNDGVGFVAPLFQASAAGTVINGAGTNLNQNMVLGTWSGGNYQAGISAQNNPYVGCTGTAQGCTFSVYANGTGSANTQVFTSGGGIEGSSNGSALSYLPPVYTAAGAAVASTLHAVSGSNNIGAGAACPADTVSCTINSNTITFSGAAAFSSTNSYSCSGTLNSSSALLVSFNQTSASAVTIIVGNPYSLSQNPNGINVNWTCVGT